MRLMYTCAGRDSSPFGYAQGKLLSFRMTNCLMLLSINLSALAGVKKDRGGLLLGGLAITLIHNSEIKVDYGKCT